MFKWDLPHLEAHLRKRENFLKMLSEFPMPHIVTFNITIELLDFISIKVQINEYELHIVKYYVIFLLNTLQIL